MSMAKLPQKPAIATDFGQPQKTDGEALALKPYLKNAFQADEKEICSQNYGGVGGVKERMEPKWLCGAASGQGIWLPTRLAVVCVTGPAVNSDVVDDGDDGGVGGFGRRHKLATKGLSSGCRGMNRRRTDRKSGHYP